MAVILYRCIFTALTLLTLMHFSKSENETALIKDYLLRYGYGEPQTETDLDMTVKKLQMFMAIPPVGFIDGAPTNKATLDRLKLARCRITDPSDKIDSPISGSKPVIPPFLHSNRTWDSATVYYNVIGSDQLVSFSENAILAWVRTTPLNFLFNGQSWNVSIEVIENTSALRNDFGQGFPPTNGTIQLRSDPANDQIIIHEIGHTLGLEHVPDPNSIMNPYYQVFSKLSGPQAGDIAGIKSLYVLCPENQTDYNGLILTWPATMKDKRVGSLELCPIYSTNAGMPKAYRYCKQTSMQSAEWEEPKEFMECLEGDPNMQATKLSKVFVNETNVVDVAAALAEISNNTMEVNSEGLNGIADTLVNIADVKQPSTQVTLSVVATVNNVLALDNEQLNDAANIGVPSKILGSLERQIETLQLKSSERSNFTDIRRNIGVIASNYHVDNVRSPLVFVKLISNEIYDGLNDINTQVYYSPEEVPENRTETSISLPVEIVDRFKEARNDSPGINNDTIPITFIIYEDGNNLLFTPDVHYCQPRAPSGDIQGNIISATVEGVDVTDLVEPVRIVINPSEGTALTSHDEARLQCSFWANRNWVSDRSCELEELKPNGQIVCACSHLTNFAVLLSPYGNVIDHIAFNLFNKIAICLSIFGLIVTIGMYLVIPKLRNQPSIQVHMNFMVSLLALYVVFLFGIDMTSYTDACIVIGILLHYLTLSTVFLMGGEAFSMFYLFVSIRGQQGGMKQISNYVIKVAVLAWGLPLFIVIPIAASNHCQYFNSEICFLPSGNPLYYGDILPIGIVIIINIVIFSMVTYKITFRRKFKKKAAATNKKDAALRESVRQFYRVLSLFTVLGLSWIFGVLSSIHAISAVFQVLFSVTTTLQGVFIFLLFCARHQDVLATWKRWAKWGSKEEHAGTGNGSKTGRFGRSDIATCPQTSPTTPTTPVSPIAIPGNSGAFLNA